MMQDAKKDIIGKLRQDILLLEGFKPPAEGSRLVTGLGPAIEGAFPHGVFPVGAIHEVLSFRPEDAAATSGFLAALLRQLMNGGGASLWISTARKLFPPALKAFGLEPERIIFVDLRRERDVLWVMEEGLRCEGFAAVVAEVGDITFMESRRLQLAVEKTQLTGFVLRHDPLKLSNTASVARWRIKPVPTQLPNDLPGVGHPRWNVELLKVRNGTPGAWQLEWRKGQFTMIHGEAPFTGLTGEQRRAG